MFKKIYLLLLLPLFLTGCMKSESLLTINKDCSAVFEQKMSTDVSSFEGSYPKAVVDYDREKKKEMLEIRTGMKIKEFKKDNDVGLIATRRIYDLRTDDWNTEMENRFYSIKTKSQDGKIVDAKKTFFKTEFEMDVEIKPVLKEGGEEDAIVHINKPEAQVEESPLENLDLTGLSPEEQEQKIQEKLKEEQEKKAQQNDNSSNGEIKVDDETLKTMEAVYKIKTPIRASFNNAANVDSKNLVYTWNLSYKDYTPVKIKFCIYNVVNIITTIVLMLIILGEAYYFTSCKKK